ncbi:alpha/beta fold hydrolase [Amycolatopsis sp. CA-230715]|uniref:alpha/beta fold hydrolase n=1 Tax=Amycolatopsis sp. CA-230715 TaxID=2745196 RepID=UPI001C039A06|nr:alpha/beta hydrolase [Amycolatopsis sp. CA-230715]QWF78487.1 putative hydrolase [Amycolatopsis sp. CA-230715]
MADEQFLAVPGARLRYQVRGAGPVLLLIPGGAMESAAFTGLAEDLAADHTVVTYDSRGISGSTREDPDADITVDTQADDAARLLAAVTDEPAFVFGSSGGAITGLALTARHPGLVRVLVAHEPPVTTLLPDFGGDDELAVIYRRDGVDAAMAKFMEIAELDGPEPDPAEYARMRANFAVFLGHMIEEIGAFEPDVDALVSASTRVVLGSGAGSSADQPARLAADAVAKLLDTQTVLFPGDHVGFAADPAGFAAKLREVL